jgi:hypothetical protein
MAEPSDVQYSSPARSAVVSVDARVRDWVGSLKQAIICWRKELS